MLHQPPRLILASASERRSALLAEAGFDFDVIPCPVDEPPIDDTPDAAAVAEFLSRFKAEQVSKSLSARFAESGGSAVILGADTIVEQDGDIFGKAADADHARQILTRLTAAPHRIITGVTLIEAPADRATVIHDITRVHMRPMSRRELEDYIAGGLWRGKAGAYGIQDQDDAFVTRIEGSWSNVVGLPMERVTVLLESFGIKSEPRPRRSEPRP